MKKIRKNQEQTNGCFMLTTINENISMMTVTKDNHWVTSSHAPERQTQKKSTHKFKRKEKYLDLNDMNQNSNVKNIFKLTIVF